MASYRGIGLMSGTSLDGIDLVYCEFREEQGFWAMELLTSETVPIEEKWYARLRCLDTADARTYAKTHVYFGHHLGRTVRDFIARHQLNPQFVASHGQTIFHQPEKNYTAQIGDGETMVSYLPCPLVANFRNSDVALGGQGAPLVPFGEQLLYPGERLFLNLGGFANLTVPGSEGQPLAFDVGACNMALNWLTRSLDPPLPYDPNGELAKGGTVDQDLLAQLEAIPHYHLPPPKSLGAEWFEAAVLPLIMNSAASVPDRLATMVEHMAARIAGDLQRLNISGLPLMATGGGVRNAFLMEQLGKRLSPLDIQLEAVPEDIVDFKEAIVFAFLGLQTLLGRPNVLASVTGAPYNHRGGSIHLPPKPKAPLNILSPLDTTTQ